MCRTGPHDPDVKVGGAQIRPGWEWAEPDGLGDCKEERDQVMVRPGVG